MIDELADLTWSMVWDQISAAFDNAVRDTLDLTPDQVDRLYQAFLQQLPVPPPGRIHEIKRSSRDQESRQAA